MFEMPRKVPKFKQAAGILSRVMQAKVSGYNVDDNNRSPTSIACHEMAIANIRHQQRC